MTEVPAQTGFTDAAIDTLTGNIGFTAMVTVLEVAGLPVGHVEMEVITQTTTSLFTGE